MFGSFGCSVRQDTNRTEQMCLMFVFGSCSVRLVRYNVVPHIFRTVGSPAGQPYAFIAGSRTAPWKLIIYITKIPVNFAVSAHFIQCGEYLITYSKLAEPNEHEPYKGHVRTEPNRYMHAGITVPPGPLYLAQVLKLLKPNDWAHVIELGVPVIQLYSSSLAEN